MNGIIHRASLAVLALAASRSPSLAQEFTSPQDVLTSLSEVILFGSTPLTNFEPYFTDRLSSAMAGGSLAASTFQELGFDPMKGLTDRELITLFRLETSPAAGRTAQAVSTFNAGTVPVRIEFELVWEGKHGWQIDQLQGTAGELLWTNEAFVEATVKN